MTSSQKKPSHLAGEGRTLFRASNAASGNNPASYLDHTSIMRTVFDWLFGTGAVSLTNRDQRAHERDPVNRTLAAPVHMFAEATIMSVISIARWRHLFTWSPMA